MDIKTSPPFDQVNNFLIDSQRKCRATEAPPDVTDIVDIMLGYIFRAMDHDGAGPCLVIQAGFHTIQSQGITMPSGICFCREKKARTGLQ